MNPIQQLPTDAPDRTPLGQILYDTGLISAEVLDHVLAEQRKTGKPLGQMLVEGGYVPARSVALALADQHGGALKTEYGFAVARPGRRRDLDAVPDAPAPASAAVTPPSKLEPAVTSDPAPLEQLEQLRRDLMTLRDQLATALTARGEAEAKSAELAQAASELSQRVRHAEEARALAESKLAEAESQRAAAETARADSETARTTTIEAELEDLRGARTAAESALADAETGRAAAEAELAELRAQIDDAPTAGVRAFEEHGHHLFIPVGAAYELATRPGAAPARGERIELDGTSYRVLRTGPSPFPGEAYACAYLEPV